MLKFDASSLPVCLVTLKGEGLSEAQLRDLGQFNVRNQMAGVPGASVPPPSADAIARSWFMWTPSNWRRIS